MWGDYRLCFKSPDFWFSLMTFESSFIVVQFRRWADTLRPNHIWGSVMPRFWPEEINLMDGEERFLVRATPRDFRRHKLLSWIPYRTGDTFLSDVEVSADRVSGTMSLQVSYTLTEPDGQQIQVIWADEPPLPFTASTERRHLAIKGEYVLDVTLSLSTESTLGVARGTKQLGTLVVQRFCIDG